MKKHVEVCFPMKLITATFNSHTSCPLVCHQIVHSPELHVHSTGWHGLYRLSPATDNNKKMYRAIQIT